MWGSRGARLWRSSAHKLRRRQGGAVGGSSLQQQQRAVSFVDSPFSPRSLSPRWESAAAFSSRDVCWRPAGSALLGLQQRMGIMTSSESLQGVDGGDQPVRSPLSQAPAPVPSAQAGSKPSVGIEKETQASSENHRASSVSDNYAPGAQKESLLRAEEIDVEDKIDDELPEEDVGEIVPDSPPRELSSLELELQNAPRRRQRFILQNALKIPNTGTAGRPRKQGFTMKVIDVNRTCKVTKGGGILNFTALVICGNGDGVAGYGKGKSAEVSAAVDKAYARALRNLHYFERFDGHTIFHEKNSKYGQTKIYLWPAQSGTGMRASHTVGGILRLAGFKNVKSKVVGSRHPHNTVKAVFQALSEIETPEEKAEREGRQRVTHHS